MTKTRRFLMTALAVCSVVVIGTGLATKAIPFPSIPTELGPELSVVAQSPTQKPAEQSEETTAVNEATLAYLTKDRPSLPQPPTIRRAVISDDYAIASWAMGEGGGQAVLSRTEGVWEVLTSGGGAVDASVLESVGVPANTAEQLVEKDRASW